MTNYPVYRVPALKNFLRVAAVVALVYMLSFVNCSTAIADGHETQNGQSEEQPGISGWFQVDVDSLGTYFLIGATHPIGGISLASNIYVNDHLGEFDLGIPFPVIKADGLSLVLLPMLGVGFDYTTTDGPDALFPQLFAFLSTDTIYFFSWTINTFASIFDDEKIDELYTRNYLIYSINETLAIGPQVEAVLGLGDKGELWSLNFGGRLNIGYGKNNTLGIYVGYDTKKDTNQTGRTGRLNFTRTW